MVSPPGTRRISLILARYRTGPYSFPHELRISETAPERSLDTVLSPESYAAIHFRTGALLDAIHITLGDNLSDDVSLSLPTDVSSDALMRWGADQASWNFVGDRWDAIGRLGRGLDPSDDMPWSHDS